ncbi:serine hydrolase domain-containing protein [Paraburkholderia hayleyella]|uniref:serine hydrolase domain-containing protein n=1 Tax=Paraburkholderia hayleyella TaxID=2152889 RepID=UPI00157FD8F1|nr:serine hydrolase domain-containing protein [Paraburkholderia hayleyella]
MRFSETASLVRGRLAAWAATWKTAREVRRATQASPGLLVLVLVLLWLGCVTAVLAQPVGTLIPGQTWQDAADGPADPGAEVERLVQHAARTTPLASVAVAVLRHGQIIKRYAIGMANIERAQPATLDTVYRIDSLTKQFTAAATMVLSQRGVIDLDAPLSRYLPDAPENWRDVRIVHLLNHTSGFPHDSPERFPPIGVQNCGEVERSLRPLYAMRVPEGFRPGDAFHYSNAGYAVLTAVLRRVTGRCYAELLDGLLFKPAGLRHTSLDMLQYADPNLAIGYQRDAFDMGWRRVPQLPSAMGAGAIKTTLGDLAAWERALEGNTILSEQSKQRMWSRTRLNNGRFSAYGLGWFIYMTGDGVRINHDGVGWGYNSAFYRYPQAGYTVLVLSNTSARDSVADRLAGQIALAYEPRLALRKKPPKQATSALGSPFARQEGERDDPGGAGRGLGAERAENDEADVAAGGDLGTGNKND